MAEADISGKWLIGQSPEAWVQWLLADSGVIVEEQLTTEFQHVSRLSDSLLRVRDQAESFLVLTELQLRHDRRMPQRMRTYAALAEEKYDLPVYPVVFYLLPPGHQTTVPDHYHSEFRGFIAHQDFTVVKAWELEATEILRQENMALLPFVPLMQGADQTIIRVGAEILREQPAGESLETLLALFASFVMDIETIQQIVRWDMTVLRESPWYQEILEEGRKQGLEQGLERGQIKGQQEAILDILRVRFGLAGQAESDVAERLAKIKSSEILHELVGVATQTDSLAAFNEHLDQKISSTE